MADITQVISTFPTPPDSGTDTPAEFDTKANAFVNHQANVYGDEVNTWAGQANGLRDEINGIVATLPAGTINDTTIGVDKVYSNQKTEATYVKKDGSTDISGTQEFSNMPTVSASPVIASGSNTNGYYIKCADGSMIQYGTLSASTTRFFQTMPMSFLDTGYRVGFSCATSDTTPSNWTIRISDRTNLGFGSYGAAPYGVGFDWIAVGSWK